MGITTALWRTSGLTGNRKKKGLIDQDTVSRGARKATGGRVSPISDTLKCGTVHGDATERNYSLKSRQEAENGEF